MKTKWRGFTVLTCLFVTFSCNVAFVSMYWDRGYRVEYVHFDMLTEIARAARFALLKQLGHVLMIENRIAYIYAESKSYKKLGHQLTVRLQELDNGES